MKMTRLDENTRQAIDRVLDLLARACASDDPVELVVLAYRELDAIRHPAAERLTAEQFAALQRALNRRAPAPPRECRRR